MARYSFVFLFFIMIVGCNSYIDKRQLTPILPPANFKASELNFTSVYERVLRPHCISCHGTSGGVSLESYAQVKEQLQKIFKSTILEQKMPKAPTSSLTEEQLGLLNAWIEAGAPENLDGVAAPLPQPLEPNFESIKTHILDVKCISCHAPGKSVARIPLITEKDLVDSPLEIVVPGNADESGIILAATNDNPRKRMPPAKDKQGNDTGFSPLSEDEIRIISLWINSMIP